jgi:hypothetical protein
MRGCPSACTGWDHDKDISVEEFEILPYLESLRFRNAWEREDRNRVMPTTTFDNIAEFWIASAQLEFLESTAALLEFPHSR